ncbi:MAG: CorA family divalent cation transporter [Myxococcaceae bacterium]
MERAPKFRARMGEAVGRQRHMVEDGHLLLVLHEVPKPGEPERAGTLFWRDKAGAWKSLAGGGVGPVRDHVSAFERAVDELEEQLRTARVAQDWFEVLKTSTPLQRTVHHLARTLQLAREAIDDRELINLRDRAGDLERAIDLVTLEARDAIAFAAARQAEVQAAHGLELARESHKLNVITAVFLPITALASIFSMTLHSGLEGVGEPWIFWVIVAAGIGLGLTMRSRLAPRSGVASAD